ncbi:hypothetical protein N7536_008047, partial [Penicillium majusculum]
FVLRRTLLPYLRVCHSFIPLSLIYCFILLYICFQISKDSQQKSSESSESPLFTDVRRNALDRIYISRTHFSTPNRLTRYFWPACRLQLFP